MNWISRFRPHICTRIHISSALKFDYHIHLDLPNQIHSRTNRIEIAGKSILCKHFAWHLSWNVKFRTPIKSIINWILSIRVKRDKFLWIDDSIRIIPINIFNIFCFYSNLHRRLLLVFVVFLSKLSVDSWITVIWIKTKAQKMGNTASHTHEPLERGYARDAYGDIKNTVCLFYLFVCVLLIFGIFFSVVLSWKRFQETCTFHSIIQNLITITSPRDNKLQFIPWHTQFTCISMSNTFACSGWQK